MDGVRTEAVGLRGAGGLGGFLGVGADHRLYRVAPVRDPRQPRFWCLAVFACSACGIPETGSAIWAGWWGSTQGELPELLDSIKADAGAWLAEEQCLSLREKLLQPRPPVRLPAARAHRKAASEPPVTSPTERAS
jgi:hypothetical protein